MRKTALKAVALIVVALFALSCFAGCSIDNDVRKAAAEFITSGKGVSVNNGVIGIDNGDDTKDDNSGNNDVGGDAVDPMTGEVIKDDKDDGNTGTADNGDDTGNDNDGGNNDSGNGGDDSGDTDNGNGDSGNNDNGGEGSQEIINNSDFGPIVSF